MATAPHGDDPSQAANPVQAGGAAQGGVPAQGGDNNRGAIEADPDVSKVPYLIRQLTTNSISSFTMAPIQAWVMMCMCYPQ